MADKIGLIELGPSGTYRVDDVLVGDGEVLARNGEARLFSAENVEHLPVSLMGRAEKATLYRSYDDLMKALPPARGVRSGGREKRLAYGHYNAPFLVAYNSDQAGQFDSQLLGRYKKTYGEVAYAAHARNNDRRNLAEIMQVVSVVAAVVIFLFIATLGYNRWAQVRAVNAAAEAAQSAGQGAAK